LYRFGLPSEYVSLDHVGFCFTFSTGFTGGQVSMHFRSSHEYRWMGYPQTFCSICPFGSYGVRSQHMYPRGHGGAGFCVRDVGRARAARGDTPGMATAARDAPMTRTARRRGIGSASVRARSSKNRSPLT
jgi:hypothetical protein